MGQSQENPNQRVYSHSQPKKIMVIFKTISATILHEGKFGATSSLHNAGKYQAANFLRKQSLKWFYTRSKWWFYDRAAQQAPDPSFAPLGDFSLPVNQKWWVKGKSRQQTFRIHPMKQRIYRGKRTWHPALKSAHQRGCDGIRIASRIRNCLAEKWRKWRDGPTLLCWKIKECVAAKFSTSSIHQWWAAAEATV